MDIEAFKATLPKSDATRDLNGFYGGFTFTEGRNGTVVVNPQWIQDNITRIPVSELPGFPLLFGTTPLKTLSLHKKVAGVFLEFWDAVHQQGIHRKLRSFDGAFYPRHKLHDPHLPLSVHSWGAALDFNATTNGYGTPPSRMDIPRDFVSLAEQYGMGWGGRWPGSWDGMHFEFVQPSKSADWNIPPVHQQVPPRLTHAVPEVTLPNKVRIFEAATNSQTGEGTVVGDKVYLHTPVKLPPGVPLKKDSQGLRLFDSGTNEHIGWGTRVGQKVYWLAGRD